MADKLEKERETGMEEVCKDRKRWNKGTSIWEIYTEE